MEGIFRDIKTHAKNKAVPLLVYLTMYIASLLFTLGIKYYVVRKGGAVQLTCTNDVEKPTIKYGTVSGLEYT